MLELKDATVIKGDRAVLDALTFTIEEGEHTAIVGPNGAGKSLLVKLLTHEVRALVTDNGQSTVRVFGSDNWDVFDLRSQLGIVSAICTSGLSPATAKAASPARPRWSPAFWRRTASCAMEW